MSITDPRGAALVRSRASGWKGLPPAEKKDNQLVPIPSSCWALLCTALSHTSSFGSRPPCWPPFAPSAANILVRWPLHCLPYLGYELLLLSGRLCSLLPFARAPCARGFAGKHSEEQSIALWNVSRVHKLKIYLLYVGRGGHYALLHMLLAG